MKRFILACAALILPLLFVPLTSYASDVNLTCSYTKPPYSSWGAYESYSCSWEQLKAEGATGTNDGVFSVPGNGLFIDTHQKTINIKCNFTFNDAMGKSRNYVFKNAEIDFLVGKSSCIKNDPSNYTCKGDLYKTQTIAIKKVTCNFHLVW